MLIMKIIFGDLLINLEKRSDEIASVCKVLSDIEEVIEASDESIIELNGDINSETNTESQD